MRILVTGATGFLGFRTIEKLSQNPNITSIIANGRVLKQSHFIGDKKVEYKLGDLQDKVLVDEITTDIDVIINCASLSSPWGSYNQFFNANVLTQMNLISAGKKHKIERFIYISSPSIYYNGKDRLNIKESDDLPRSFINSYASTKRQAELLLEEAPFEYIILRPRALIGRGDTVIMPRLIKAYLNNSLRIIGNGKNLVDLTSVENVVEAIQLSLFADKSAVNHAYNISNAKPVYVWEHIEEVLDLLGYRLTSKSIPAWVLHYVAGLMELKSNWFTHKEPVLTQYSIGTLSKSFTMDISKAKEILKYKPIFTLEHSMKEFVDWYKTCP